MLVLVAPLGIAATAAQAQDQLWLTQFGTSSDEEARALSPDDAGGVMVAGHTLGSLGGPNAGEEDAWVARYDGEGERLWIRQFGTSSFERVIALAADSAGGVFVTGRTEGDLGGPNAGGADVFLARYDAQGNQLWMRQFGTPQRDWANALAPDGAGGVIVAGSTMGILAVRSLAGRMSGSHVMTARATSSGFASSAHSMLTGPMRWRATRWGM